MSKFSEGDKVRIMCSVQPGAFSNERLITIKTDESEISGFIDAKYLTLTSESNGYVEGKVISVSPQSVTIQLPASMFRGASGKTSVNSAWATSNLRSVAG